MVNRKPREMVLLTAFFCSTRLASASPVDGPPPERMGEKRAPAMEKDFRIKGGCKEELMYV